MENNSTILELLIHHFKSAYPCGSEAFGERAIVKAIEDQNPQLIKTLIEAKFSINRICHIGADCASSALNELSAMGFAAQHEKGTSYKAICELLKHGTADLTRRPWNWKIPRNHAYSSYTVQGLGYSEVSCDHGR